MDSVRKARSRLRMYPQLLAKCSESAGVYAKCVTQNSSVKKDDCLKEFENFKTCLIKASKDLKTKM
ncbi:NADH dehydrogenase [ubiquinone] 1 alpha subcomplex assembly factor 8 [Arctopsyche grandis]|uniref:NADH dehydrogenase [ubiquinone] 1 alpha subcomplex assembly factor 8 n=1 Tax=Arctopsyche grandis TaxID=121162 RepID=UPI00406D8CA1